MRVRVIDLETENHEYLGSKASPHCEQNYIVMPGWRDYNWDGTPIDEEVSHLYFENREQAEAGDWFNLEGVDILVAHNAMFEMGWFLSRHREESLTFLKRGGRVLCTAQAEYHITHQVDTYPALDVVAPRYGGTQKVDGITILWEQGHLTSEIDKELLLEYLAGPEGDIENTARTFFGQRTKLVEQGQWDAYLERCEALVAYALCEDAGLYIDVETAEKNLAEQEAELERMSAEMQKHLPELPEHFDFNWGSLYHVSALLFGGSIKYQARVPYDPPKYEKADYYYFGEHRVPVADVEQYGAAGFEVHGPCVMFKSGKNKGLPKVFREDTDVEKLKWEDATFAFKAAVPIETLPAVLREKFMGKRPEWQTKLELPCGTPVYSSNSDVLEALAKHGFSLAELMADYATLLKDTGAFYRMVTYNKDGSVKKVSGMLQYVGADNIIHHSLNTTATSTGRLSASKPNMQQLPKDGHSKVKQMFASRFGADGRMIEVDYTALEVVVLAALSGDHDLLEALMSGTDMHLFRLAGAADNWGGLSYEELLAVYKDRNHPRHREVADARDAIKPRAFAAQYGASASGISFATGCTVEEAQEFLDNEAKLFPESIAFRDVVYKAVQSSGERNIQREQRDDGSWGVYHRGHWQSPGGTCYSFREYPAWREGQQIMDYKATQIANYPVQGEAAFLVSVTAGRVARWLIGQNFYNGRALLCNHVHDALILDCHKDVAVEVATTVRDIMQDVAKYVSARLGYDIADIPFPATAEVGATLYDLEGI